MVLREMLGVTGATACAFGAGRRVRAARRERPRWKRRFFASEGRLATDWRICVFIRENSEGGVGTNNLQE